MVDIAWHALRIRSRYAAISKNQLEGRGYEVFLPTYLRPEFGAGRTRGVITPLFPGYLFCRFPYNQRLPILTAPGVISVVAHGRRPSPISDQEIANIRDAVKAQYRVSPCEYLSTGDAVRIVGGSLSGMEGLLLRSKDGGQRLVLSISLLSRSVAVEVDRELLCPVSRAAMVAAAAAPTVVRPLSGI